jgi:hypothetical protein
VQVSDEGGCPGVCRSWLTRRRRPICRWRIQSAVAQVAGGLRCGFWEAWRWHGELVFSELTQHPDVEDYPVLQ